MITLHINTSTLDETYISLTHDSQKWEKKSISKEKRTQLVLPIIEELLKESTYSLDQITHITVATGPGSYTGIRVGVAIAATLSFLLKIPINEYPPGTIPEISYGNDLWDFSPVNK